MPGPPPPPPPMMAPVKKAFVPAATKTANGGDNRNALLASIQKGAQLKKVKTVDKSAPIGAGRIAGEPTSTVPRSKVVTTSTKTSPDTSSSSPVSGKKPGGFANLTDELQFKLTLKKNKSSPSKEPISYSEPKEPSPPASSNSLLNEIKSKQSVTISHHTPAPPSPSISDAIANKSSLFNKTQASPSTALSTPKVINHGKPNLAPKPPPQLKLVTSGFNDDSNRKIVSRHQSMKSPRSPPLAVPPLDNHFGTIRMNPSNQQKIQDALNLQAPVQKPSGQRPTNKPPPPPPRRDERTNLTNNHAKSTNALNLSAVEQNISAGKRLPNSGSSNNLEKSFSNIERSVDGTDSPPLPPHRITSSQAQLRAPQTPIITNNQAPPEVPRRHSSMRNSIENNANGKYPKVNPSQAITKLVVDLEARYSVLFHNVSEFPTPRPFMNIEKSYPSRAVRQSNGI